MEPAQGRNPETTCEQSRVRTYNTEPVAIDTHAIAKNTQYHRGGKHLPTDNGGSEIFCSPRSSDFRHGLLRYANLFFIPICFPLFDVCCCCYLYFPHQIIYFVCPVLIPDCHPRVCVNVYRFSYGFISTVSIPIDIGNLFRLPNMCQYFLLNPIIEKPCCCTGIL